jgi:protein TonB
MNRQVVKSSICPEHVAGGLLVLALHGVALWGLISHRLVALPVQMPTLFVSLVTPAVPQLRRPVPVAPASAPSKHVKPRPPGAEPSVVAALTANELPVAAAPSSMPLPAVAPAPTLAPAIGPVSLAGELSISCVERSSPEYPLVSRRRNETGTALLHVELDEAGQVATAVIIASSGHSRLDEAALTAVKRWRCNPAQRNGQAVRATARQAFNFVLQGT